MPGPGLVARDTAVHAVPVNESPVRHNLNFHQKKLANDGPIEPQVNIKYKLG